MANPQRARLRGKLEGIRMAIASCSGLQHERTSQRKSRSTSDEEHQGFMSGIAACKRNLKRLLDALQEQTEKPAERAGEEGQHA